MTSMLYVEQALNCVYQWRLARSDARVKVAARPGGHAALLRHSIHPRRGTDENEKENI